ncbi:hypothetical protein pb186bvf_017371 [Paramecium bursaria]
MSSANFSSKPQNYQCNLILCKEMTYQNFILAFKGVSSIWMNEYIKQQTANLLAILLLWREIIRNCKNNHINRLDERNSLMESVEQIRNDYDKVCGKYMELHKKYQNELKKNEMLKQEVDTQQELLKQYKLALIRDRVTDLPQPDYNIYKGVKCYIKNNESQFSLFLGTILHQVKHEKMINLENLLAQIDKYYKQSKVKISPQKLSITQSNEERLPRIQKVERIKYKLKPIRNESLQLKAVSIERGERSRSFY